MGDQMTSQQSTRTKKRILFSCAVLFFLLVLLLLANRHSARPADQIAALKRAGFPTAVPDLNDFYTAVPSNRNAALIIVEASEKFAAPSRDLRDLRLPKIGERISDELLVAAATHLDQNTEAFSLLMTALQFPASRYPIIFIDQNTSILAHLAGVKSLAQLLSYHSLFHSSKGDFSSAFSSLTNGFKLAASLRGMPVIVSELVRIACVSIALNNLEQFLAHRSLTADQAFLISNLLINAEADSNYSVNRALIGERAFGIEGFHATSSAPLPASVSTAERMKSGFYEFLGFHDRDLRLYLEFTDRLIEATSHPFPEAYEKTMQLDRELQARFSRGLGRFAILSRGVLPALRNVVRKEAALVTRLRCAQTAVALDQFRLAQATTGQSFHTNLAALIPAYLSQLPVDPVAGEPLSIELIPGGFRVFSTIAADELENKPSAQFSVIRNH
jgi:hypothetical protein